MSLTVVILAAGLGKRMGCAFPKVMQRIAGVPMIEYLLETAQQLPTNDIRLVVSDNLQNFLKSNPICPDYNFKMVLQKEPLGTADALSTAVKSAPLASKVLVLYGDAPLVSLGALHAMLKKREESQEISMVSLGFDAELPHGYGRMIVIDDYVVNIVEEKDATKEQREISLCHSGMILVDREVLEECLDKINNNNAAGEYYLTNIVEIAHRSGYACGYTIADELEVFGINSQNQLAEANFIVQTKLRQKLLNSGVKMHDPNSTFLSKDTIIGHDTQLEPFIYIGPGVQIGSGCLIRAFTHLEGAVIDDGCTIGPFARIRPNTSVGKHSKIGNFAEVKNSEIAGGVRANHVSYIGDAEVGEASNIGAGTVFCNYDGKHKHRSVVGRGAFVGANTSIIAPLNMGENSWIAAGSVVNKDIADHEMGIARVRQVNMPLKGKRSSSVAGSKQGQKAEG